MRQLLTLDNAIPGPSDPGSLASPVGPFWAAVRLVRVRPERKALF